ncbi:MAG: dihydrolipoamide acetyltransferase family protein [Chloroflexota bacterium]
MPKVDMDQETGTVAEWRKQNGEEVQEGEVILVIETDKVAVDVEAPGSGVLDGISAHPGDTVPIGTVIAYILEPGEALPAAAAPEKPAEAAVSASPPLQTAAVAATPVAQNMAASHGIDLTAVPPTGSGGKVTKADVQAALERIAEQPDGDGKVYATPAARRVARENTVELTAIQGSGPQGRIQASDVEAYASRLSFPEGQVEPQSLEPEVIPLIGMRRTIAEQMTVSYQTIPHIKFTSRIDMTKFIAARKDLNALAEKRGEPKISATALFVKLVAMTLRAHPWLNSSLAEDQILLHKEINIGVAVALEKGLIVPVIKNADQKGISQLAVEVNDYAIRARDGELVSADVKGGTFTISNLGPFSVEQFEAIINPPEAAILAIGGTQAQAVPLDDGQIVSRPIMSITLSADHRIVDGAVAARFVADLKSTFENPFLQTCSEQP